MVLFVSYDWRDLSLKHRKEFCSFSACQDLCNVSGLCSCPKWEKGNANYEFFKKITQKLDDDVKLQLCELTECSYKTDKENDSSCRFYSRRESDKGTQYCSSWFRIKDLSVLLDPVSVVIVKKKIEIEDMDERIKEIANRWNVETA
jgi:hypothetical protein